MTTEERAVDMILRRTDIAEDDARYYVELSEMRVREHLKLEVSVDLVSYLSSIVTIAILLYQADTSSKNASTSLGYKSQSMSEGGISKSTTTYTGSEISQMYEDQIEDVLARLGGRVRFL